MLFQYKLQYQNERNIVITPQLGSPHSVQQTTSLESVTLG